MKKKKLLAIILTLVMIFGLVPQTAFAAAGQTPAHTKNITNNNDGTYTISLDVVGDSEKKPNPVNVIVILDRSGSMNNNSGGYGSQSRMAAAKNAVNNLANSLLAYNTTSFPNTVQMALVSFSTTASTSSSGSGSSAVNYTNSYSTFSGWVNGLNPNGGTNWEDALQDAKNVSFGDTDPTYVIFVSDGNPTFRNTRGDYTNLDQNSDYPNVYGTGFDDRTYGGITAATTISRCYDHAVDDAQALATAVDVAVAEGSAPFKTGGTDLDYTKVNGVSELPKSKFSNGTFSFTGDNSDGMKTIWVTIADGDYAGKYQVYPNPDASDGMNAIKR